MEEGQEASKEDNATQFAVLNRESNVGVDVDTMKKNNEMKICSSTEDSNNTIEYGSERKASVEF